MDIAFLIGRILFGMYFVMSGIQHFRHLQNMTGYASSKKVPAPKYSVMLAGVVIVFAGLGVVLGVYTTISLIALAVFLVVVAFWMHDFWRAEDPNEKMAEMHQFLKNIALAGGALMALMIGDWPMSL